MCVCYMNRKKSPLFPLICQSAHFWSTCAFFFNRGRERHLVCLMRSYTWVFIFIAQITCGARYVCTRLLTRPFTLGMSWGRTSIFFFYPSIHPSIFYCQALHRKEERLCSRCVRAVTAVEAAAATATRPCQLPACMALLETAIQLAMGQQQEIRIFSLKFLEQLSTGQIKLHLAFSFDCFC